MMRKCARQLPRCPESSPYWVTDSNRIGCDTQTIYLTRDGQAMAIERRQIQLR